MVAKQFSTFSLANYLKYGGIRANFSLSCLQLGSSGDDTERSDGFWNHSSVAMKFTVERLRVDAVWNCKSKPNYGMCGLDAILEE